MAHNTVNPIQWIDAIEDCMPPLDGGYYLFKFWTVPILKEEYWCRDGVECSLSLNWTTIDTVIPDWSLKHYKPNVKTLDITVDCLDDSHKETLRDMTPVVFKKYLRKLNHCNAALMDLKAWFPMYELD